MHLAPCSTAQQPNPKDFAVPDAAFRDFSADHFGGASIVKSRSFTAWLGRTGDFGILVALHDKRDFNNASDPKSTLNVGGKQEEDPNGNAKEVFPIPDDRVCDIAYQLIRKKYDSEPLSYRYDLKKREKLISRLIERVQASENETFTTKPEKLEASRE